MFVDAGSIRIRIASECDIQTLEKLVASGQQRLRGVCLGLDGRLPLENDDTISKICGHDKVMLDDEGGLLGVHDESLDDTGSNDALLGIEIPSGLLN